MSEKRYLLEAHAHTSDISMCSALAPRELVVLLKEQGYDAVVLTNHYLPGLFETQAQRESFYQSYQLTRSIGEELGLVVLPGMELRFNDGFYDDFLVYVPDPDMLRRYEGLTEMDIRSFHRLAQAEGMLVYQAHPFRSGMHVAPPEALDGIEIHNGNPHHDSHNDQAAAFAQAHGLRTLSGSDVHELYGASRGGIYVPQSALTPEGLVDYLRNTQKPALFQPESR